ncbi:hypothetical protein E2C01_098355 [Portunus trituberculatus]|uniref:Uncharacterized protein n=1 Tax=Portunus trituberculatus TaxID=210409 RepID=A0A5B7K2S7_PORTR|nr:hypothetical protein [Portunus trituberculatus]
MLVTKTTQCDAADASLVAV